MLSYKRDDIKEALRNIERAKTALKNVQNYGEEPKKRLLFLKKNVQVECAKILKINEEISNLTSSVSKKSASSQNRIAFPEILKPIYNPQKERIKKIRELTKRFPVKNKIK